MRKKTRVLALALDGQKKGLSAMNTNKHMCDILSSAPLQLKSDGDDSVKVDINIEDYFTLADLKCQNQPLLTDFLASAGESRSSTRKRPKKLLMRPAEIVQIMIDEDEDDEITLKKKTPRLDELDFMSWALGDNKTAVSNSPTECSLPSLNSSPTHSDESPQPPIPSPGKSDAVDNNDTLVDSSATKTPEHNHGKAEGISEGMNNRFTKLQNKNAISPISLDETETGSLEKNPGIISIIQRDLDITANFNIIPCKSGTPNDRADSDMSADLFSDSSSFGDLLDDIKTETEPLETSVVDKAEEARLAAELMCDDVVADDEDAEYWICQCSSVNDKELECCSKCALPRLPTTWMCKKCQTVNRISDEMCDECLTERDYSKDEHGEEERVVDIASIVIHMKFFFLVSHHTHRIFLHDKDKNYLESSFHAIDLENVDLLPDVLLKPENFELAKDFVTKWNGLKKREQKSLVKKGELIECPEQAYFGGKLTRLRKPTKQRYKSKTDIASDAAQHCQSNPGAQTRLIIKPSKDPNQLPSTSNAGYVQVMSADNKPLCISCHSEYESDLLSTSVISDEKHAWQTRFCSPQCADKFWMASHTDYIRKTAKSLDGGTCEQCGVDGNQVFIRVKRSRSMKERAELIQNSRYGALSANVKINMVKDPTEGQFWHVDHILPVYAGGGQCEVDNLRTLCTPCHQIVTAAQAGHRAKMRASIGNHSISDFFSPVTKGKLKDYD